MSDTNNFNVNRDETLDLSSFVKPKVIQPIVEGDATIVSNTKTEKKSPLQEMLDKQNNATTGYKVTNEEFNKGLENAPNAVSGMAAQRGKDISEYLSNMDESMKKRAAVIITREPKNAVEHAQIMDEIESVTFTKDGPKFMVSNDVQVPSKDKDGNDIMVWNHTMEEYTPSFMRIRTENDPPFNMETDKKFVENHDFKADPYTSETTQDSMSTGSVDVNEEKSDPEDETKKKSIEVIIDKTNLGSDVVFSDDEKDKIIKAYEIKLKEIEVIDISTVRTKRPERSFQETIKAQQISSARNLCCFPTSGFKAHMSGLSYGELGDITLSLDGIDFDKHNKRLSVVYNKMSNMSCKPFDSYEDFLKKFAYADVEMAIYGLYIATFPEVYEVQLNCGNKSCEKSFNWKFSTRALLHMNLSSATFVNKMANLVQAIPADYDKIQAEAAVNNSKFVKMPDTGYIIEFGVMSCYDYLYNFLPAINKDTFAANFGEDADMYEALVPFLVAVRSIRVPDEDGEYILCDGFKDILDAIYMLSPRDMQILSSISDEVSSAYSATFALDKVVCPHCGTVTEVMPLSVDQLLFQTLQHLMSTEVDAKHIQL